MTRQERIALRKVWDYLKSRRTRSYQPSRADRRRGSVGRRLARLVRLRKMGAPRWIIRAEQVALLLNACGMVAPGIGSDMSSVAASTLYDTYVLPHMGQK